jgi:hypothetical protein
MLHDKGLEDATVIADDCDLRNAIADSRAIKYLDSDGQVYYRYKGTLAHLLDTRPSPVGEPSAGNLPSTVNPMEFLIKNILRNNAYLIKLKVVAGVSVNSISGYLDKIRDLTPPNCVIILLLELTASDDELNANTAPDGYPTILTRVSDTTKSSFMAPEPTNTTLSAIATISDTTFIGYRINDR